jgi:hypothetical protein
MENITIIKRLSAEDRTIATAKPSLRCYRCHTVYHYRIKRHWFVKYVLFFLPVKIYFCGHCVKERYILLTDKGETKYKPV